jgi:hypothetical protein
VPEGASRLTGLSVQSGSDPSGPRKPLSRRLLRLVVSPVLQLVQQPPALRDEEESIWKMWRHPSGIWDMSREPLCRYLDMRRAGTMGALSCCAGSQASGVSQALWYVLGRVATQLESS